jgi:hypothetical protein
VQTFQYFFDISCYGYSVSLYFVGSGLCLDMLNPLFPIKNSTTYFYYYSFLLSRPSPFHQHCHQPHRSAFQMRRKSRSNPSLENRCKCLK